MTGGIEAAVAGFLAHKRALGRKYDSEENELRLLVRFAAGQGVSSLGELTPALLDEFLASRPRSRPRSFNHLLGVVRCLLDWVVTQELLGVSPLQARPRRVTSSLIPFLFDTALARQLLDAAAALPDNSRARGRAATYRAIFALCYGLGLRAGEACGLRLGDIDTSRRLLVVRGGKFGKSRLVPHGPRIAALINEQARRRQAEGAARPDAPLAGDEVRIGKFAVDLAEGLSAPVTLRFPFRAGLFIHGAAEMRVPAVGLARAVCARLLAAVPAGKLRFSFVDPVSLGQSVADFQHLADFDKQLVGVRPATSVREIEERLAGLSAHVETVTSEYLRGKFASIEDYNEIAGELAESYQVLVVFDYPAGFSEQAAQQLLALAENGPRCGVHAVVVADSARQQPRDLPLDRLLLNQYCLSWVPGSSGLRARLDLGVHGGQFKRDIIPDISPVIEFDQDGMPRSAVAALPATVGEIARGSGNEPVTLRRLLPVLNHVIATGRSTGLPQVSPQVVLDAADQSTWWRGSTAANAVAPLGLSEAKDVAAMFFSSVDR